MGIVGTYDLVLYCDHADHADHDQPAGNFTGRSETSCLRQAREDGWLVTKRIDVPASMSGGGSGKAICPRHYRKRAAPPTDTEGRTPAERGGP